jgi:hypothetical protein
MKTTIKVFTLHTDSGTRNLQQKKQKKKLDINTPRYINKQCSYVLIKNTNYVC